MSQLLVIAALVAGFVAAVAKGILAKELHGYVEWRIRMSVEAAIASLPEELQAKYAAPWRADLEVKITRPVSAVAYARRLRRSAAQLARASSPASGAKARADAPRRERHGQPAHERQGTGGPDNRPVAMVGRLEPHDLISDVALGVSAGAIAGYMGAGAFVGVFVGVGVFLGVILADLVFLVPHRR